ncbi:AAA domain-containing protein [Nitrosomonas cryotolerans]|uniref:AAA domain-containing protein n=1 Tax=Nitrosomonas cryotolerans ATCC 49181 TaxID=1131553 RepID=A0A1N6JY41_9PROT|nr:AAA domain-containing protein [Nitrosomonas cryotolerans]SFQ11266.1 AAA domain-containing protein [Nitrosomonas cryotolerans]SIO49151.1 AAA domain-containing protein [Nitrosomonas cryotolerans ATCC 49181]
MSKQQPNLHIEPEVSIDFVDHIDHWLEYLTALLGNADKATKPKLERQIKYLLGFRAGTNCNINHNRLLQYYYSNQAKEGGDNISLPDESYSAEDECVPNKRSSEAQASVDSFIAEFKAREGSTSMSIHPTQPIQKSYQPNDSAFKLILKALASEDLFFMQGPPGTGKTTAIVEIVLQLIKAKPNVRILISSETHVAVDNALDRLANEASTELMESILRYPKFSISEFECEKTPQADALTRADTLWHKAHEAAPELTKQLWTDLAACVENDSGVPSIARWQARSLAEMHQVIGVTCNQIDHLRDRETQMFDLAIVDECSKATMPEWLMAMSVAKKCILVGDHKQLPPTFCTEESEVLEQMNDNKEGLIRNGVIERLFENLPSNMKGTLGKQFRMLPDIGLFISHHFYKGELEHHRTETDHEFQDFGWLTYKSNGYRVPAQRGEEKKILINCFEIRIIMDRLAEINERLLQAKIERKISVALITPYRAQSKELCKALKKHDFRETITVEVDTVDAFQGRQADIVFFSFVRNTGPAKFYADDRRMNVAISRARDAVYLVGDVDYIVSKSKSLSVLGALIKLPILNKHGNKDF